MIHDLVVAPVNPTPRPDGHAQFGTLLPADALVLQAMGTGQNVPGNLFTMDGKPPHGPSPFDHFPDVQPNVVPLYLSTGTYNALQQCPESDKTPDSP